MSRKNKKDVPVVTRFTSFFDFALVDNSTSSSPKSEHICRLEFEIVAGEKCPKATENFRQLASGVVTVGEKRNQRQATYKGTRLLRCTPEMIQLGDTNPVGVAGNANANTAGNNNASNNNNKDASNNKDAADSNTATFGKTQDTIFGTLIEDECFGVVPHSFGTVTLCNNGPNTNGSQFSIIVGGENDEEEAAAASEGSASAAGNNNSATTDFSFLDARHVSLGLLRDPSNRFYQQQQERFASSSVVAPPPQPQSGRSANGKNNQQQQQDQQQQDASSNYLDKREPAENQTEALRKLHQVALSLVQDRSGRLLPNKGNSYIIVADCGVY